ncbi:MAG: UvrD-helicase domain-containing protein [Lachnospiraceae bacterium]|nr:UvrD-helicase domain-containing protein [Lachnospiraceae bacterium]
MKFTDNQEKATIVGGQNILVSAAAGSGKTAVLTERILKSLVRKDSPVDIDRILVMTFTTAAAGEMRDRIRQSINMSLQKGDTSGRLFRQAALIHNAHISTIHGFCLDVIRSHFHRIELSPDFRIMDETEGKLMMADVLDEILEEAYEAGEEGFLKMSEHIASGKNDRALEEAILKLHGFAVSNPDVEKWFQTCIEMYENIDLARIDAHPLVQELMRYYKELVAEFADSAQKALECAQEAGGPYTYADSITHDIKTLEELQNAETYAAFASCIRSYENEKLKPVPKKGYELDPELQEETKRLRGIVKDGLEKLKREDFTSDISDAVTLMVSCGTDVEQLVGLTRRFHTRFLETKRRKGLVDFNDMEHFCLRILTENPDIAEEYRQFFREIYVDEYQDSNYVQEAIVEAIANNNVFNVGDVKQSIYRFRMARPDLFLRKYKEYADGNGGIRIDLYDNFRSRAEVIDAVNEVFEKVMRPEVGGIDYDENARLHFKADCYKEAHVIESGETASEEAEKETQRVVHKDVTEPDYENVTSPEGGTNGVDPDGHNRYVAEYVGILKNDAVDPKELEASYIANRILELIRSGMPVYDKGLEGFRPVRFSDITILLRSKSGWDTTFCRVIEEYGIPIHSASSTGYFSAREVVWLLSFLQVIDNPLQDIPLASVLLSPLGKLTEAELALVRAEAPGAALYQCLCSFSESPTDRVNTSVIEKIRHFLSMLHGYREKSPYTSVYEILQEIVDGDYGREIMASQGGRKRFANLNMLLNRALEFEKTSYRGLFQFVRYIEYLKKMEIDYGEANLSGENENTVRLMSIHKSKGLEYPVVFLAGMHKQMNFSDASDNLVLDSDLGIGIRCVDSERRTKMQTIGRMAIGRKIRRENLAEEIRVLYVAMTRAREKLIMTGIAEDEDAPLGNKGGLLKADSYRALLSYASDETGRFRHIEVKTTSVISMIETQLEQELRREDIGLGILSAIRQAGEGQSEATPELLTLKERFGYRYPVDENDFFGKISVTELKKRSMAISAAEEYEDGERIADAGAGPGADADREPLRIPAFLAGKEAPSPTAHGTAFHRLLEIWDYTLASDPESVRSFMEQTGQKKRMEADMLGMVQPEEILSFLQTDLAGRMKDAAGRGELYREQPFLIAVDSGTLVQGIIDAFFIEDNGIVVVDYKTDRVQDAQTLVDRYHVQLDYYGTALHRLTGIPVKEKLIYSAVLRRTIPL